MSSGGDCCARTPSPVRSRTADDDPSPQTTERTRAEEVADEHRTPTDAEAFDMLVQMRGQLCWNEWMGKWDGSAGDENRVSANGDDPGEVVRELHAKWLRAGAEVRGKLTWAREVVISAWLKVRALERGDELSKQLPAWPEVSRG